MATLQFDFPDEESAREFVRSVAIKIKDIAIFVDEHRVYVVDGSHIHGREIIRMARDLFGKFE